MARARATSRSDLEQGPVDALVVVVHLDEHRLGVEEEHRRTFRDARSIRGHPDAYGSIPILHRTLELASGFLMVLGVMLRLDDEHEFLRGLTLRRAGPVGSRE